MTVKLYYDDATLLEFTAAVVAQKTTKRGQAVCLNKSAFYPTSGGQPHDTGTLNGIPVVDVWEDEVGAVWHLLERPLEKATVIGLVNQYRRFDHMQQHTGQHLLSASFYNLHKANTIGFHLGTVDSTIDLDIPELSWETAFSVEDDVNAVIWENRPVEISYVTDGKIDQIPLRKPPKVAGSIRVIWVKDFDASACGGTHVQSTGEVGIIKISRLEHYKGGIRIAFLCGKRALHDYQKNLRTLQLAGECLSVAGSEVPEAIQRLQNAVHTERKESARLQSALMDLEAGRLWAGAPEINGVRCMVAHWTDRSFADARRIANQLRVRHRVFMLFAVTEGKGVRYICARSDDLPSLNARNILTSTLEKLGGRGGGSPFLAQGGSQPYPSEEILKVLNKVHSSVSSQIAQITEVR